MSAEDSLIFNKMLKESIKQGNIDVLKQLLIFNFKIDSQLLFTVLSNTHKDYDKFYEIFRILLMADTDIMVKTKLNDTLLHITAMIFDYRFSEMLITLGLNVNTKNAYDSIPLHYAAYTNNIDVIKLLINANSDIIIKNKHDKQPLDYANQQTKQQIYDELKLTSDYI